MKKLMILGALLGFLISAASGRAQGSAWPTVLWRASVCALCAGVLLRLWARVWLTSIQKVAADRIAASTAAEPQAFVLPSKSNRL